MADDLSFLRERNLLLLAKLQEAQKSVQTDIRGIKTNGRSSRGATLSEFRGHGPDRTPVTLQRKAKERVQEHSELASRLFSTPRKEGKKENTPKTVRDLKLSSILRTPSSQRKKKATVGGSHVTFNPATPLRDNTTPGKADHSVLGYDWIAGMLDNTSYLAEKDDTFFNELNEFRRVNRNECSGSTFLQQSQSKPPLNTLHTKDFNQDKRSHHCSDTYVLDDRFFPVPIHGSDAYCDVCKTRKPYEYESEDSYVRVSVPRSALQSPHRVKAHRRKSFDPTDTVSLSKHCLLGWQSSRPAIIPAHSSLDLRADTGISKLNALNWSSMLSSKHNFLRQTAQTNYTKE